jgi:hypothetical protein
MKRIWNETEPHGLIIKSMEGNAWIPSDFSIIEFALTVYSKKSWLESTVYDCISKSSLFFDLISYDKTKIHPNILIGQRPLSRKSNLFWVDFPKPPKKDIILWTEFLTTLIEPILHSKVIVWNTALHPNYYNTYSHSSCTDNTQRK